MRIFGILLFALFVIWGCSSKINTQNNNEFFNLYTTLIEDLKSSDVKLIKYIKKGKESDTIAVDTVNWDEEFNLFTNLFISKSNYSDYKITSSEDGCEKSFQTKNNKHEVKNYDYSICNGELIVYIDVKKTSPLYVFDYHLELNKNGYLIEVKSNVDLAYTSDYRIEGKFNYLNK